MLKNIDKKQVETLIIFKMYKKQWKHCIVAAAGKAHVL